MITLLKQVSIFIICAQVIMHFKAEQKYGKYLKLLIGVMVLVQLFVPLMSLFGRGEEIFEKNLAYYVERFSETSDADSDIYNSGNADFTELQLQEVKSIFNNAQGEKEEEKTSGEQVHIYGNTANEKIGESDITQSADPDAEIMIERIEVKPDDG